MRTSTTTPGQPASAITRLLPPPMTSTGSPPASASRTASTSSSVVVAVTNRRAGPPRRSVVRSAIAAGTVCDVTGVPRLARVSGGAGSQRLAAGRARALGLPTRGTTNPNRLRRMDNWIAARLGAGAARGRRSAGDRSRLRRDAGDRGRAADAAAAGARRRPGARPGDRPAARGRRRCRPRGRRALTFAVGGFELAGHRPAIVRAANVLRQYAPAEAAARVGDDACRAGPGRRARRGHVRRDRPARCLGAARCRRSGVADAGVPRRVAQPAVRPRGAAAEGADPPQRRRAADPRVAAASFDAAWDAAAPVSVFGARQRWTRRAPALRRARLAGRRAPARGTAS